MWKCLSHDAPQQDGQGEQTKLIAHALQYDTVLWITAGWHGASRFCLFTFLTVCMCIFMLCSLSVSLSLSVEWSGANC